jgi:hypothetical protein
MCLLVTQSSSSPILSDAWLENFYDYNSDGVGVMFSNNGDLVIKKIIPKSAKDFIQFYRSDIQGRDCAFHLRMRTHGAIDLINCHPYEVLNRAEHGIDLWLMHNGILSTGNKANEKLSDTWHYINDYLKPMLSGNPDFAFHPAFKALVADHIGGSNKFVLMDNEGRQVVINESAGVYWAGLWLSNTYAWDASSSAGKNKVNAKKAKKQAKEIPELRSSYKNSYSSYHLWDDDYVSYQKSYGIDVGSYGIYKNPEKDIESVVESNLDDLDYMGFTHGITVGQALDFVDEFGLEGFLDVIDQVIDQQLPIDWFNQVMTDYKVARECFPYLGKYEGIENGI